MGAAAGIASGLATGAASGVGIPHQAPPPPSRHFTVDVKTHLWFHGTGLVCAPFGTVGGSAGVGGILCYRWDQAKRDRLQIEPGTLVVWLDRDGSAGVAANGNSALRPLLRRTRVTSHLDPVPGMSFSLAGTTIKCEFGKGKAVAPRELAVICYRSARGRPRRNSGAFGITDRYAILFRYDADGDVVVNARRRH